MGFQRQNWAVGQRECEFAALKKAYYRRARECHPDRFGNDPDKAEEFKAVVEAFVTLSDPEKRRCQRSLAAPDGNASGEFQIAFNEPEGLWTLRISDVATGVSATQKITVR